MTDSKTAVYCTVVEAHLSVKVCPLPKGSCYWQHRQSNECRFTEKDITPDEFCALTSADPVTQEDLEEFRNRLRDTL